MRTTKPISTISYNTPAFLELKLNELITSGKIQFWAFIKHKPEDDEAGKKEHIHVYIEPAKMLQTVELQPFFKQFIDFDIKPLGCIPFISSKFDPWCLYALHDKRYLASKGQSRKYHYKYTELYSSDEDALRFKFRMIDQLSLSPYADIEDAICQGLTFDEYFARGTIPLPQINLYKSAWDYLTSYHTNRNGRSDHNDNEFA